MDYQIIDYIENHPILLSGLSQSTDTLLVTICQYALRKELIANFVQTFAVQQGKSLKLNKKTIVTALHITSSI